MHSSLHTVSANRLCKLSVRTISHTTYSILKLAEETFIR